MKSLLCKSTLAIALLGVIGAASADTLLIQRVQQETANMPKRGATAAQVQARFGAPSEQLAPQGGQRRAWPTITRWVYPAFTVYFQHGHVIDAVANHATPDEIGPKPVK